MSDEERRVRQVLDRPGVRNILASRIREAKVREDREAEERRRDREEVLPHVPSVVRYVRRITYTSVYVYVYLMSMSSYVYVYLMSMSVYVLICTYPN